MIRGASVTGREHVRLGKNNQDAWAFAEGDGARAIVVADGCSSEKCSEVGAQLGSQWLAAWLVSHASRSEGPLASEATRALTKWLYRLAGTIEGELARVVQQYFLFTFLAAVTAGERTLVFGMGDGLVWVDGRLTVLDSGPANAPHYAAYRLLGGSSEADIHFEGEAAHVALMTDGLEPLSTRAAELFTGLGSSPMSLQRRLNVINERERLSDDATIACLETTS